MVKISCQEKNTHQPKIILIHNKINKLEFGGKKIFIFPLHFPFPHDILLAQCTANTIKSIKIIKNWAILSNEIGASPKSFPLLL